MPADPTASLPSPVPQARLYRHADLSGLDFATTGELAALPGLTEQPRAASAIAFTEITHRGFNIFASGARVQEAVKALLQDAAHARPADWVYVNNFAAPHRPMAIEHAARPADDQQKLTLLVEQLQRGLVAAVLRDEHDPALEVAARVAPASDNDLLLTLPKAARAAAIERAAAFGMPRARIAARAIVAFEADAAIAALGSGREHLIVIGRDSGAGSAAGIAELAAARGACRYW